LKRKRSFSQCKGIKGVNLTHYKQSALVVGEL